MEKATLTSLYKLPVPSRLQQSMVQGTFAIFLVVSLFAFSRIIPTRPNQGLSWQEERVRPDISSTGNSFSWLDIKPSKNLEYKSCYDGFYCARLDVPLNWNASGKDDGQRAAIAIVKLPAKVPVTDMRYGGAIILNPGGPGGSGMKQVFGGGNFVQTIVDSPTAIYDFQQTSKYFDIIGFDPRGVNNTTPRLNCFPDAVSEQAWDLQVEGTGSMDNSERAFEFKWARSIALGESCTRERNGVSPAKYVNTAQVVEDIVQIIESHGKWREIQGQKIVDSMKDSRVFINKALEPSNTAIAILERTRWNKGKEMLQYWGFSYGTVLGATFSAMHPERVSRVIIDGVVDGLDYYQTTWLKNLQDTDKMIPKFCDYCFAAGPDKCALYSGNSSRDIEHRIHILLKEVHDTPVVVLASDTRGPEIITYDDIIDLVGGALYEPYREIEETFKILADLSKGDGSKLADAKQQRYLPISKSLQCKKDGPFSNSCIPTKKDGSKTLCTDGSDVTSITKAEFKLYREMLKSQSRWFGDFWSNIRLDCIGWRARPAWTFDGAIKGITAHPLLLIGNSLDPVTPIQNAHTMSKAFPGSVVLHHDAEGHCSYSYPAICTGKAIRKYFQIGELPAAGTVCTPHRRPFLGCVDVDEKGACIEMSQMDKILWTAMEGLTRVWP